MSRIISKAELARLAGVSRTAVTKACKHALYDATLKNGVDLEHPLVIQWLAAKGIHEIPAEVTKPKKSGKKSATAKQAQASSGGGKINKPSRGGTGNIASFGIKDLEDLTVREVVMRYGSIDGFKRFVESLKNIAEYKHRELRVMEQRGELIQRSKVARVVFPLIDVAFARLVSDVPDSLAKLVIARAESGGVETLADITELIRNANSRVLKNVKLTAGKLEFLADENN